MEKKKEIDRRAFLSFLGALAPGAILAPTVLSGCEHKQWPKNGENIEFLLKGIQPDNTDEISLAKGFDWNILIKYQDPINAEDYFGFNNDFTTFLPDEGSTTSGLLWVNHEYVDLKFLTGRTDGSLPTKEQADKEMYNVGGSFIRVEKIKDVWTFVPNHQFNRRYTANTKFDFLWDDKVQGTNEAYGTLANCAGGKTPWGTILTCEENYHDAFGERNTDDGSIKPGRYRWETLYNRPPEHYGWVVEIDPNTGLGQKLVALGRCAHECATVHQLKDGRVVVYTGDDKKDECIYKFVSSKPNSLSEGTLYVANLGEKKWVSLDINDHKILQDNFESQTEILIRLREAARLVGGTLCDRPEDIEIDPITGHVFIALTNNKPKGNYFGSILKIAEGNELHDSLSFEWEIFRTGGEESGFACPDNLAFDNSGNLWFTSDISGSAMNKEPYTNFGNNGLFVVPRFGLKAGEVIQIASAPMDAEFTGPSFNADQTALFLSVQHPGEESSQDLSHLTSHWPNKEGLPAPAVVVITGEGLEYLTQINLPE